MKPGGEVYMSFQHYDPDDPNSWLNVYWVLAGLSALSFLFLYRVEFNEGEEIPGADLADDAKQMALLMTKLLLNSQNETSILHKMIKYYL